MPEIILPIISNMPVNAAKMALTISFQKSMIKMIARIIIIVYFNVQLEALQ